jgi:D-alanine-D-alanine ligase
LREAGYQVAEIDVGHDVAALVEALTPPPDAVFNALHGRWGEDGCVQGVLEAAKRLFEAAGLTCPEGVVVDAQDLATGDALPRPFVVKPVNEGSSVGVRIVKNGTNLPPVDLDQWPPGTKLMVEKFIAGRELTVAVMGERPLAVTEIRPRQGFYDYEAKYTDGRADHVIPAQIPAEVYDRALEMAVTAHRALGCRGVSRADFRYDDTAKAAGDLYLLEINTQPGMTPLSLVPEQAAYLKIEFPELCAWMVEHAACDG